MTHALRWAAMRAILMFRNCEGQSHKTVSTDHNLWRERRAKADSNRGSSAYQPNALPLGQTGSLKQCTSYRITELKPDHTFEAQSCFTLGTTLPLFLQHFKVIVNEQTWVVFLYLLCAGVCLGVGLCVIVGSRDRRSMQLLPKMYYYASLTFILFFYFFIFCQAHRCGAFNHTTYIHYNNMFTFIHTSFCL